MLNELDYEVEGLAIRESLKEKLYFFNEKMEMILKRDNYIPFDIVIDNMNREDINIMLEYITNMLEDNYCFEKTIKFRNLRDSEVKNSVIVIDKIDVFEDEILDNWKREKKIFNFFCNTRLNNNILIFTCNDSIDNHLSDLDNLFFDTRQSIHINLLESKKELYNKLMKNYKDNNISCSLSFDTYKKLYDNLEDNRYIRCLDINNYLYDYSIKRLILDNKDIINDETFSDILEENEKEKEDKCIDNLVGLNNIKKQLDSLYNYLNFSKNMKKENNIYLNLLFLGNPGTGKTTVARMYAKKLYDLGFIKENKLIEIVPNDLMAEYVGQTRNKTRKILSAAENGVLFIDEAYLLYANNYNNGNNPYMNEAIVEIVKYLEDPKNVVIFAGYPKETREIYNANTGLKSRIYGEIMFDDYSDKELYEILDSDLKDKGLSLDKKSKKKVIGYISKIRQDKNFGNARTIKQLSQRMIMNHANRKNNSKSLLLSDKDLPKKEEKSKNILKMGFDNYDRK